MVEDLWVRWRTINWNVRESEIFLSLCVSILHVISIDESSSLWNISPKQIFRLLKNSFWHSRGILVVSCETLWWAALLVDGPRAFLVKQWSVGAWACHILDDFKRFSRRSPTNKHYTTTVNRQKWEIDRRFLVSVVIDLLLVIPVNI